MAEQRSSRAFAEGARTLVALIAVSCASSRGANHVGWGAAQLEGERRCQGGSAGACGQLGAWLVEAGGDDRTFEAGLVLLETACGRDDAPACAKLGGIYLRGYKQEAGKARGRELLKRACERGGAEACTALGEASAHATPREGEASLDLFRKGCKLGDDRACELLGQAELRDGLSGDRVVAEQAFALACGRGRRASCHLLALERLRDPARAQNGFDMLADNCKHGHGDSCLTLAMLGAPLLSHAPDCDRARPWAQLACRANNVDGCSLQAACELGVPGRRADALERLLRSCQQDSALACLYWADAQPASGQNDREAQRTATAYEVACGEGLEIACARGAAFALAGARTTTEAERPLEWLRRACDRANAEACCALSDAVRSATWLPADAAKAAELRTKACERGCVRCCESGPRPAATVK
jgi:TPR repeat protein